MQAVILAAGVGQRLGADAQQRPKSLLEFDGISLLARHLHILAHYGIEHISVVTGYEHAQIEAALHTCNNKLKLDISTFYNPEFRLGSVISFHTAAPILASGDDVLLMDADVLYDMHMIDRLLKTRHANCFLLDRDFVPGDEPVKLCVQNNRLIDFRKRIDKNLHFDFQGESVGFFRFSAAMATGLIERAQAYIEAGRNTEPYEEIIRDALLADTTAFGFEDVSGLAWIEIDFPEDVERARQEILPVITLPQSIST